MDKEIKPQVYMNLDDKARQHIKKKRQHLTDKGRYSQS